MTALLDEVGNVIRLGDRVKVTYIDTGRGAYMWMDEATVVGLGRTRVMLRFATHAVHCAVGSETLRVVTPVDGRPLRTWADVCRDKETA